MAIFPRITLHTDTLTANMLGPNRSFSLIMTLNIKKNGPTYRYTCTCVLQTNVFSAVTQGWTAVECRAYIPLYIGASENIYCRFKSLNIILS